jgi:hypothetical protein
MPVSGPATVFATTGTDAADKPASETLRRKFLLFIVGVLVETAALAAS